MHHIAYSSPFTLVFSLVSSFCFSVHAIIATPGRILDLLNKNLVKIGKCGIMVLDEVSVLHFVPRHTEWQGVM